MNKKVSLIQWTIIRSHTEVIVKFKLTSIFLQFLEILNRDSKGNFSQLCKSQRTEALWNFVLKVK